MPLNGRFIEKYGQRWAEMDDGQKQMALMSEIFDLREAIEPISEICKTVEKHKTYFKWIGVAIVSIAIPLVFMLIKFYFTGSP